MVPFGEVKCICSDSGSEVTIHDFQALLTKCKIRHETLPPRQNDTAESSWQTEFSDSLSLLRESQLPDVQMSAYVTHHEAMAAESTQ